MERFISFLLRLRNRHLLVLDLLILSITPAIALVLRTDGGGVFGAYVAPLILVVTPIFVLTKLLILYAGRLYTRFWRYASLDEMVQIIALCTLGLLAQTGIFFLIMRPLGWVPPDFPRSIPLIDGLLAIITVGGIRFSVPLMDRWQVRGHDKPQGKQVLIVGAGPAGVAIAREMQNSPQLRLCPVGFVDDADEKQGMRIAGVRVVSRISEIPVVARKLDVNQIIIAMPKASGKVIRNLFSLCEQANIQPKIIPAMSQILGGAVSIKQLRDVEIEDLLRREPIHTDVSAVKELVRGKRVLVTGGGGSIGSELCRQVLGFGPDMLVILGHGENSVFEIYNELVKLKLRGPARIEDNGFWDATGTELRSVIADIRSLDRLQVVMKEFRPQIVFHCAAHKHVPLMEVDPSEAVTNNILGTRNLLEVSQAFQVEHFVMISTDKAVNPSSVMGASKRVAELLVHQTAVQSGKPYVAVRFGNVLGSRGSVVLTFREQIAAGGPVTITHPEMKRYFMTIPEAVQLVLQAATLGSGGEVFMLDMGEPVKIVDLARDIIELSGLRPDHDIDIVYSGLRPGEKLFEELFIKGEDYKRTQHEKVFIVGNASSFVPIWLDERIASLEASARYNDRGAILACLRDLVPEFSPQTPLVPQPGLIREPVKRFQRIPEVGAPVWEAS